MKNVLMCIRTGFMITDFSFNYLGNMISYERELDIKKKLFENYWYFK
jgi:hypothetical protein